MPAPRMRDALAPRPFVSSPSPRFLAFAPTSAPAPPVFLVQQLTASLAPMDLEDERDDEIVEAVAEDEAAELYKPWQTRFQDALTAIMAEESSRADRALRCKLAAASLKTLTTSCRRGESVPRRVAGTS
jgi:sigma54-dependent transcription regulator